MNNLTLKQLEAFYWAGTCGSFAIAADKLHISQSSLSKRLGELEDGLGRVLFDRTGRRAVLTPHGAALVPRVRLLLNQADELAANMGTDSIVRGRCRLGVGEIAASSWLPKLVFRLRERYPDLTLEPFVDLGLELEAKLISGKLDAAMIARHSTHPALDSVLLAQVEYVWVAAPTMVTKGRKVEDLVGETPVVSMSRQAGSTRILDAWRQESRAIISELVECNSMVTMAGLVSAGLAVGYLPRGWLRPLLRKKVLKIIESSTPLKTLDYRFHWRLDDTRPLTARLREVALEVVDYDTPLLML
jgi:DNA-binding transcriptional LysR family regulator